MKKNRITILILLLLIIASVAVIFKNKKSTLTGKDDDFAVADTSTVDKIFIANKVGGAATLEKMNGRWMINGRYPARMDNLTLLLQTFHNVEIKFPAPENAQASLLKYIASKGAKCEIYQNGKLSKTWYVGHETQDMRGTYCLLQGGDNDKPFDRVYAIEIPGFIGILGPRFFTSEEDWRDKKVLALTPDKIKNVTVNSLDLPDSSYSIDVKGLHSFKITTLTGRKIQPFDTAAVKQYLSYFMNLYVEAWCTNSKEHEIDSVMKSEHYLELSVTDTHDKKYDFKFYHKPPNKEQNADKDEKGNLLPFDPDYMYVRLQDDKEFARVAVFQWGKIFQSANYFLPQRKK